MAKGRGWFCWVKKLCTSEARTKTEKKSNKWRCFRRFKLKQCPALTAPERTLSEVTEEQRKHVLNVALASVAAAEAAIAAAQAAAEVVRLTGASDIYLNTQKWDVNFAATKIQSAFRAYLARKALRALKGLVRLQAIVRGQAVRRQRNATMHSLPSDTKLQKEVQKTIIPSTYENPKVGEKELSYKEIKVQCNSRRSWDSSILSKEDMDAIMLRKQEAIVKRERMKKYSFSHRERGNAQMLEESEPNKENTRQSCRREPWTDRDASLHGTTQVNQTSMQKHYLQEELNFPYSFPRRSFSHSKHNSVEDDSIMTNSPVLRTYTTVTDSANARLRSMSTPKQRLRFSDTFSDRSFLYKNGVSFWSSYNGESTSNNGKSCASQQIPVIMNSHY